MGTRRNREKITSILASAYPELEENEVERLLGEAQERKREGVGYVLVRPDNGKRLEIESLKVM